MKAIGRVVAADAIGNLSVQMFYDGKWQGSWSLTNKMPANHPDFGLFEFEMHDQFCEWLDPNKIDEEHENCSVCGGRLAEKDIGGGRCYNCWSMIVARVPDSLKLNECLKG